ncbi:MAG: IS5 family transposase [Candidatus Diapherotrites archaeon]
MHNFYRSKKMYNNFVHIFLLVLKQRLKLSYRRLEALASEFGLQRMLCIKRIPHFTTMQKAMQRLSKSLLERMVRACHSLLDLKGMLVGIDGTGFSNTNPSHYYIKRIDGVKVKNYTKTVLIADLDTKLVLGLKTHSDYSSETLDFIPLVRELKHSLKCVLADKGYDARTNRSYCDEQGIEHIIPHRQWKKSRAQEFGTPSRRALEAKKTDIIKYKRRALVESVMSAIKRPFGSWVCSRKPQNQQKETTIKILAYNLEIIGRKITTTIIYIWTTILHRHI